MWKHRCVKQEMATSITKRRQSLSFSAKSFSDIPAMKKSFAIKLCWQNSFSLFRRTTRDWSHSQYSPRTGIAPTHAYINLFSFWLNNLYTEIQCLQMKLSSTTIGPNCMSRLQNHAMLRDAATEVLIYRMFCWRNMARPQSREFFRGKLIF